MIDLRVVVDREGCARSEDMLSETNNFILIILPLEKALFRGIIQAFSVATLHAHDRLGSAKVLIRLEGHVAEQDANVLPLQDSIIIKIIP